MSKAYREWLMKFVEEKGLDTDHVFEVEGAFYGTNYISLDCVLEGICNSCKQDQEAIRKKIVMIDFRNGDVMHFFNYLAKAMAI